jgi:hypothetical protein
VTGELQSSLASLTASDWAAWVQAIGTVFAIVGAWWFSNRQARTQHESSLEMFRTAQAQSRADATRNLLAQCEAFINLATPCIEVVRTGTWMARSIDLDRKSMGQIVENLSRIPLYTLPHTLVEPTVSISSLASRLGEKIEEGLRVRDLDGGKHVADVVTQIQVLQKWLEGQIEVIRQELEMRIS